MANFQFYAKLSNEIGGLITDSKLDVVEALAYGYSNKSIANEFNVSVKAVEKNVSDIHKVFNSNSKFFNSRIRVISSMIANNFIDYSTPNNSSKVPELNEDLTRTLILSSVGLSNATIAELLNISQKCVETRLGQLFDYFGIDSKKQNVENPRVLLLVTAYIKGNITKELIKKVYKETNCKRLERVVEDPDFFIENLQSVNKVIG